MKLFFLLCDTIWVADANGGNLFSRQLASKGSDDSNVCELQAAVGECDATIERWYHNVNNGACETFVWGGCGGNSNKFTSLASCEDTCSVEVKTCSLSAEEGPCAAAILRYYYDSTEKVCKTFPYGGCGGNANRFETQEACELACGE